MGKKIVTVHVEGGLVENVTGLLIHQTYRVLYHEEESYRWDELQPYFEWLLEEDEEYDATKILKSIRGLMRLVEDA